MGALNRSAATAAVAVAVARPASPALPRWLTLALAYIAAALALRGAAFGYPAIHIDEQFYLLVGSRLLDGTLPYVDIWDRKPIGLFLIYATASALGGTGIVQYQVFAALSAAATAFVVNRIASRIAGPRGSWWAGVAYLLYLSAFNCFGGQAPVFYNLPMALAAWALVAAPPARLLAAGAGAMALVGIALQIKYSAVFEGIAFGLVLLARAVGQGWSRPRLAGAALLWIGCALAPTLLALAAYAALGHAGDFIFANFTSIFLRDENFAGALWRLTKESAALLPLGLAALARPRTVRGEAWPFLRYWAICAIAGFLLFGTWYDHYVAPLLAPLAVLAAPALDRGWRYRALTVGFGAVAALHMTTHQLGNHGTRAQIAAMAGLIRQELHGGCAYLNEGHPIFYHLSGACLATRWPFPTHLAGGVEAQALGIDAGREMARIVASRPRVVVVATKPVAKPPNLASRAALLRALARDYRPYAKARVGNHDYLLYRLKPQAVP